MRLKELLIYFAISIYKINSLKFVNNSDILNIIHEIISSQTSITTVNYIDSVINSTRYSMDYDFTLELYKKIEPKLAICDISSHLERKKSDRLWFFNLLKISSMMDFEKIIRKFSDKNFDYSGFYIILFESALLNEVHQIFQKMWDLYIYNVNLIRYTNNSIKIETFIPFSQNSCNVTTPVEITSFENGKFTKKLFEFFPKKFQNFYNCSFNLTTFESIGPAVLKTDFKNGTYRLHGRDIDIIYTISKKLNFHPLIFYNRTYGGWGSMNFDGSGTGAFYSAKLRITDVAFGNVNLKIERVLNLGYTTPYAADILVFLIPPGKRLSSMQKLLRPFDNVVWISLSFVFSAGFIIIGFIEIKCRRKVKRVIFGTRVNAHMMNFLVAIFGGSQPNLPKGNFARFILMIFLLFCLVMRALYQGSLFEFLQSDDKEREPQTIAEIAMRDYSFYMILSYADFSKGNVHMEGRRYTISPEYIKKLMIDVLNPEFKGTMMLKMSQVLYSNRERSRGNQELYRICKEYYMSVPITMYFPKNSYLVDLFNNLILLFHQSGLMSYWTLVNEDPRYLNVKPITGQPKRITLQHLSSPFQILIGCCSAAFAVFVFEIIHHNRLWRKLNPTKIQKIKISRLGKMLQDRL